MKDRWGASVDRWRARQVVWMVPYGPHMYVNTARRTGRFSRTTNNKKHVQCVISIRQKTIENDCCICELSMRNLHDSSVQTYRRINANLFYVLAVKKKQMALLFSPTFLYTESTFPFVSLLCIELWCIDWRVYIQRPEIHDKLAI